MAQGMVVLGKSKAQGKEERGTQKVPGTVCDEPKVKLQGTEALGKEAPGNQKAPGTGGQGTQKALGPQMAQGMAVQGTEARGIQKALGTACEQLLELKTLELGAEAQQEELARRAEPWQLRRRPRQ